MTTPNVGEVAFFLPKALVFKKNDVGNSFFGEVSGWQYFPLDPGAVYSVSVTSHVNYPVTVHVSTANSGASRIASHSIPAMAENMRLREIPVTVDDPRYLSVQSTGSEPPGGMLTVRLIPIPSPAIL